MQFQQKCGDESQVRESHSRDVFHDPAAERMLSEVGVSLNIGILPHILGYFLV